ncbi:hypothetical protein BJX61DRAFT_547845 [Aspergillus egyptiacus]|nr:hypothetical protein BJX61DRAFT_547845 [Aspergillus egyptiacus]
MSLSRGIGLLLLEMAALGLAVPFASHSQLQARSDIPWQETQTYKDYDWNDLCNVYNPEGINDPGLAETLWTELGVGVWFDEWLFNHPNKDYWTSTMDDEVQDNASGQFSCHQLTSSSCDAPSDCHHHVNQGMGPAFWVLYSAYKLHDALSQVHDAVNDGTISLGLELEQMIEKFGPQSTEGEVDAMGALAAAFTIAAGATVEVPPLAGALTAVAGVFSMASVLTPSSEPQDPTAELKVKLQQSYDMAREALDQANRVIFGDPGNGGSTEDLPLQVGEYRDAMARFFAEGKFLGGAVIGSLTELTNEWKHRHQQALSAWFIAHMGYIVTVATNKGNRADCEAMNMWSTYFHEPTSRCFNVMRYNPGGWGVMPLEIDDGPMSVAMNDYGVDKDEFYNNAYGCAEAFPDGGGKVEIDIKTLPLDGTLPTCFFNVPLVEGWIEPNGYGWAWLKDIGLNSAHAVGNRLG